MIKNRKYLAVSVVLALALKGHIFFPYQCFESPRPGVILCGVLGHKQKHQHARWCFFEYVAYVEKGPQFEQGRSPISSQISPFPQKSRKIVSQTAQHDRKLPDIKKCAARCKKALRRAK